jgi:hypothetical protein
VRKRNKRIWAHLNDDEYERFIEQVKQSGLSMESYLRFLINGLVPKPKPSADYFTMTNELRNIGISIRHIASKAAASHMIGSEDLLRFTVNLDRQISAIQDAVELPYRKS